MNRESTGDRAAEERRPRPHRPARADRKAQRLERGRRDILDAAERALGERGDIGSLTMEDIAAEAGYTAGALYGYFPSKQAIVMALLRRIEEEMLAVISAPAPSGATFEERMRRFREGLDGIAREHVGLFHAFLAIGWGPGAEDIEEALDLHEAFLGHLDALFALGIREGRIAERRPRDLSIAFLGIHREFFVHWLFSDRSEPLEDRSGRAHAIFLGGAAARDGEKGE